MDQLLKPAVRSNPNRQRLFLCRHGETDLNRLGKLQGARKDPSLNATGFDQASALARELVELAPSTQIVASSTMLRARQTAAAVAEALGQDASRIEAMPEFNDIDFGPVADGLPLDEALARSDAVWAAWAGGDLQAQPLEGGESLAAVLDRFARGAQALLSAAHDDVVIVTHSGLLEVVMAAALAHVSANNHHPQKAWWWRHAPASWNLLVARHMREDNVCVNELVFCGPELDALVRVPRVAYRRFWHAP